MWRTVSFVFILISIIAPTEEQFFETCYPRVGCIPWMDGWPLLNPRKPPRSPEELKNTFFFFNREHRWRGVNATIYPGVGHIPVKRNKKTYVLIPGWLDTEISDWIIMMKNYLLDEAEVNILSLGWYAEMSAFYSQVVADSQVIGRLVAVALMELRIKPSKTEIICHSVGCEVAAHASTYIQSLSGKTFKKMVLFDASRYDYPPRTFRLRRFHADFVLAIHSADNPISGFGIIRPYGDVDIYINNAMRQPGCHASMIMDVKHSLKYKQCSHNSLPEWYIYIIKNKHCPAVARRLNPITFLEAHFNSLTDAAFAKLLHLYPTCSQVDCLKIDEHMEDTNLVGIFVLITDVRKHPICMVPDHNIP